MLGGFCGHVADLTLEVRGLSLPNVNGLVLRRVDAQGCALPYHESVKVVNWD
jgi:hypothetical protein